ncbi:MAG: sugar transferase [Patescibacteria group bacterium]
MKKFELFFTLLQLPLDFALLILAGFTAYTLRFADFAKAIRPVLFNLSWQRYWPLVLLTAAAWIIIFALSGLYSTNPNRKLARDLTRVVMATATGFAGITIYVFFTLQKFDSRFLVLVGWILAIIFVSLGRILTAGLKIWLHKAGVGLRRTIIIGKEIIGQEIKQSLLNKSFGYKVVATYDGFDVASEPTILKLKPDEIIFTDPKANEKEALEAIDFANEHHIAFKYSADLFSTISTNMAVSTITGIPIIELRLTRLTGWGRIFKRLIDIIGSIFFIIILSPIYLIISLIILIETGRPVIYKNERVGKADKKFFTLKFRSMYQKDSNGIQFGKKASTVALAKEQELIKKQSIKNGPIYKIKNDPRVTPFGRFIRRWSIDELPQFFNVFKGEMSLVGPRPHQPREVENYERKHKIVLEIKPGITGLAQISGRSNLSYEEEIKLDTFYIENWSLFLDLIILIKTPFVVIRKTGSL